MNKKIIIILVAALFLGSACEDFLSVNEKNPNNASEVAPKLVLPDALNQVARIMNNPRNFDFVYLWHGLWSISAGYSQPTALTQYRLTNSNYQNPFNLSYIAGQNFKEIEKASTDPKDVNFLAIAKIMKAYIFQNLVDCYGDVPYSEAFNTEGGILKPKYDDQQEIYEDLVLKLDEAIVLIENAPDDAIELTAGSDVMYHGDMGLWQKFANTLKLRILMHQSGMSGRDSYITSSIATTAAVGYLAAGESGLINPGYLVSDGKMNNFYETFYKANGSTQSDGVTYYFAGKDVVDHLKSMNDPRLGKFFKPYSGSNYDGNYFGTPGDLLTVQALTSQLGYSASDANTMIGAATKSCPMLTDFESLFIQAEAAERGFIAGSAKALYESAIQQSFAYMGKSADFAAYIAQDLGQVSYDVAPDRIELILTQKWVALNGNAPVEIWTDFRRTGFPDFITWSTDPQRENDTPPIRLLYPQREITTNNDQLLLVGDIDAFESKIFWQNR